MGKSLILRLSFCPSYDMIKISKAVTLLTALFIRQIVKFKLNILVDRKTHKGL